MEKIFLISYSEIGLKGENRPFFEKILVKNIKRSLNKFNNLTVERTHGRIYVKVEGNADEVTDRLSKVFGIAHICPALTTELDLEQINTTALELLKEYENYSGKTFKVETRRANKSFPYTSPETSKLVGGYILTNTDDGLKVDVKTPEILINIEIREKVYVYLEKNPGLRGLPIGVSGKALLLLSGGIDSPVAGWMTMKRGVEISAIYYHSFPFTSDRAKEKVIDLCRILSEYSGSLKLFVVDFTDVLKVLNKDIPSKYLTISMRRMMIKIAEKVAIEEGALSLITGESIGQVASQTLESIAASDAATSLPIIRPLITFDKEEIIDISNKIGTYNISTRPYEDCCTVFVPKHPKTRPSLDEVKLAEKNLDYEKLVENALNRIEIINIVNDGY